MESGAGRIKRDFNRYVLILLISIFSSKITAQQTLKTYYDGSKQLYCVEQWNKKHTAAHFSFFYEDGKLKAEGCKIKDRKSGHYEEPDSFFRAYGADGSTVQEMKMNTDSVIVYTYDEGGILRGKIWAGHNYCYEEQYYLDGNIMVKTECRLPDTLDYFKDFYYYPAKWIAQNKNNRPQPLLPVHYGTAGNDGVSAPGTFKIYFIANTEMPKPNKGSCNVTTYYPDGKVLVTVTDALYPVKKTCSRNGREDKDTTREYYPNGKLKEIAYPDSGREGFIRYTWFENGNRSSKTYCRYSPLNADTSVSVAALRDAVNRAYAAGLTEISFYQNGLLSSQRTLLIAVKYDSTGALAEETINNLAIGYYPGFNSELNTTGLLHKGLFKEGVRDGEWKAFYSSDTSKPCYRVNYKNGLLSGDAIVYDSLGRLMQQCFAKDGYYDGPLVKFNNGDTAEAGNYKNGLQDGRWHYYRKGKLVRVDSFNYTSRKLFSGTLITYNTDPYYKESERIYTSDTEYLEIGYYPNGNKKYESAVNNNVRSTKAYDENGNLIK